MGRGQNEHYRVSPPASEGWTKQELMEVVVFPEEMDSASDPGPRRFNRRRRGGLSPTTFDSIRKAARVRGPSHGGRNWVFPPEDIAAMIRCAEGGRFTDRGGPIAAAWRALLAEHGFRVPPAE